MGQINYLGANPSSQEQEETVDESVLKVNNVVHSFRLQQTTFDKKSYLTYLKVRFFISCRHTILMINSGLYERSEGKTACGSCRRV